MRANVVWGWCWLLILICFDFVVVACCLLVCGFEFVWFKSGLCWLLHVGLIVVLCLITAVCKLVMVCWWLG